MRYYEPEQIFAKNMSFKFRVYKARLQNPVQEHRHPSLYELIIILEGMGVHKIDDTRYLVSSGDVFMIKGEEAHRFENCQNMTIIDMMFDPAILNNNMAYLKKIPGFISFFDLEPIFRSEHRFKSRLTLTRPELDQAMEFVEILIHESNSTPVGYEAAVMGVLVQLMVFLSRCYEGFEKPHTEELMRIARAIQFIDSHYLNDVTVPYLAGLANLSVNQFHRIFLTATGTTPIDYINRRRISDARESLLHSNMSVTRIAFDCGFSDSNYFSRVFKKYVGTSPTDYRRRLL